MMKGQGNGNAVAAAAGACPNASEGERKGINPELWHACAGPLVTLPTAGSLVVYFPQGHSEQVAASMQKNVDAHVPNYPNLPSKLICLLHNVTLHADSETDEVYAQMTLQPINTNNKEALLASDLTHNPHKPQTEFFCKTLTASDTSTHGGFSVPRRAAEKIFPPLDFTMQPPVQELQARDLHDNVWTFRHIYRGQPKRHLLTTGWSLFVSGKRLVAGDSVLFIRDEKSQLLLGIRRANKQPNNIPSSVLSSDSMHIGILAAAAHAAANNSPFTVFYNPRASPSEFVIPLAKYNKAMYSNHISLGMRFRMMFETEESGTRRYMGTITGISDLDPVRWKNSQWRNLQVGWDESAPGERRNRVSVWEIEPVVAPFFICPQPFFGSKHPRQPGMLDESLDMENLYKRVRPWLGEEISIKDSQSQNTLMPGLSLAQWMNMPQNPILANSSMQPDYLRSLTGHVLQNLGGTELSRQLGLQAQILQQNNIKFNAQRPHQQIQQIDQISKLSVPMNQLGTITVPQLQPQDISLQQRQHLVNQAYQLSQTQSPHTQPQILIPSQVQQQPALIQTFQPPQTSLLHNQPQQLPLQQQQQVLNQQQQQSKMPLHIPHQMSQQPQLSEQQIQLQLFQKLQQQQQQQQPPLLPQQMLQQPQPIQEQQNILIETPQHLTNSHSNSQQNTVPQQIVKNTPMGMQFSQSLQHQIQQKPLQQARELPGVVFPPLANLFSPPVSCLPTGAAAKSATTDDAPSCSTSPSTNNAPSLPHTIINKTSGPVTADGVPHHSATTLNPGIFEGLSEIPNIGRGLQKSENEVKPSLPVSKAQNVGTGAPQACLGSASQLDYLDSSSATSVCLSQADGQQQQQQQRNFPLPSFNQLSMFRGTTPEAEVQAADPGNLFGVNIDSTLGIPQLTNSLLADNIGSGKDYLNNLSSANMVSNCNSKEAQQELSSSYISQPLGVPDAAFNSIESSINDSTILNKSSWAPPPQFQKMRTYTKVHKRGAVGRSIDITRYSGYDELKQDLARMFSIGGQIQDLQRMGWKLVYVDHENDVLLVGDDPWEEFVSCVGCIKILSPQEVQQLSLDGDLGNNILPNQTCSSSDGGNAWRDQCDQNPVFPSGSYDHFR